MEAPPIGIMPRKLSEERYVINRINDILNAVLLSDALLRAAHVASES